jgi:hypothetical protein
MAPVLGKKIRLRRLTKVDLAWLHFKAAIAFMLFVPLWQAPSFAASVTGYMLLAWGIVSAAGVIVSVVGLVLGAQNEQWRQKGFRIEMVGLWLLLAGPLTFMAVQIGLWATGGRWTGLGIMFPYVIAASIGARMAMVRLSMKTVIYRFPGEEVDD